jgi:hypothetical protein
VTSRKLDEPLSSLGHIWLLAHLPATMSNEKGLLESLELLMEVAEMSEQAHWRATPFKEGYKIIYNDETIEISVFTDSPKNIEAVQQQILKGLNAINGTSTQTNEYQFVSLPPLLSKKEKN